MQLKSIVTKRVKHWAHLQAHTNLSACMCLQMCHATATSEINNLLFCLVDVSKLNSDIALSMLVKGIRHAWHIGRRSASAFVLSGLLLYHI